MRARKTPVMRLAVAAVVSVALSGCMWSPGHWMDKQELESGKTVDDVSLQLTPITPQLIMEQEKARPPVTVPAELVNYQPGSYQIGPGDVLYVTVWDHPELTVPSGAQQQIESNGRLVRPNGEFFFPYIGNIHAAGMTIEGLAAHMTTELAKYIDKPQLDVAVIRYGSRKVYLSGAFANTAPIVLNSKPLTLVEALGMAGAMGNSFGASSVSAVNADLSNLKFTRDGKEYTLDVYALNRDSAYTSKIYLKDGDTLHLNYSDEKKVFVMGEVTNQTSLNYHADKLSLTEALAAVGGMNQNTANGNSVYIIRGGLDDMQKDKARIYQLSGKSATGFILANRFQLQPQDVVYVGPTDLTRWKRVIEEILPTVQMLNLQTGAGVDIQTLSHSRE